MAGLDVNTLDTDINGTGSLLLAGNAESQTVNLNGFGQSHAGDLACQWAEVKLNGTGQIEVWAITGLHVELNGLGSVRYYGIPL